MESGGPDMKETRGAQWGGVAVEGTAYVSSGTRSHPKGSLVGYGRTQWDSMRATSGPLTE